MPPKLRRRVLKFLPKLRFFLFGALLGLLILAIFKITPPAVTFLKNLSLGSSVLWSVITNRPLSLKEDSGRTNLLILGVAGGDREGANLTDTMIFSSIDLKTNEIMMVSLPRDIWVPSLKNKINSAYELGEEKQKGGGIVLTKAVVEDILDQPVHYAVLIDFSGFKKMIDLFGGVEVEVENTFDDYKYPIVGRENDFCNGDPGYQCRFEHLHFDQGRQFMDGERALKYVRSRQAEGKEGTDFARSQRQQKVILALKQKVLSYETLLNPGKILALKKIFGESIMTDIRFSEIDDFLKIAKKLNLAKIKTLTLDMGDEENGRDGFLVNPPPLQYGGAWVLIPRLGNWGEIQKYLSSQLKENSL